MTPRLPLRRSWWEVVLARVSDPGTDPRFRVFEYRTSLVLARTKRRAEARAGTGWPGRWRVLESLRLP